MEMKDAGACARHFCAPILSHHEAGSAVEFAGPRASNGANTPATVGVDATRSTRDRLFVHVMVTRNPAEAPLFRLEGWTQEIQPPVISTRPGIDFAARCWQATELYFPVMNLQKD